MPMQCNSKLRPIRCAFALAALLGLPLSLLAAKPKIVAASVDPTNRSMLHILFDSPRPTAASLQDKVFWIVYQKTAAGSARVLVDHVETTDFDSTGEIVLDMTSPFPITDLKEIDIILANASDFIEIPALTSQAELGAGTRTDTGAIAKSKGKADSDVYFSGSYTGVQGGDPVYDIDAFAGYMHAIQHATSYYGSVGFYGQIRTKTSAVVDPDSFLTYLVYQYPIGHGWWNLGTSDRAPSFQKPILSFRAVGAEFSRTGTQVNLISSPVLTFPIRPIAPPTRASGKVDPWPQINIGLGTEFVYVKKSILAPQGVWHTRGLASGTFATGYSPKLKICDSITLTSNYQGRFTSSPEIFYDSKFAPIDPTTGKPNPKKTPPMLGTQPRHDIDTKLTYNFLPFTGVTFEHTYGSLPPIFNKTQNSYAFGLTVNFQFSEFGRYSILRP